MLPQPQSRSFGRNLTPLVSHVLELGGKPVRIGRFEQVLRSIPTELKLSIFRANQQVHRDVCHGRALTSSIGHGITSAGGCIASGSHSSSSHNQTT